MSLLSFIAVEVIIEKRLFRKLHDYVSSLYSFSFSWLVVCDVYMGLALCVLSFELFGKLSAMVSVEQVFWCPIQGGLEVFVHPHLGP